MIVGSVMISMIVLFSTKNIIHSYPECDNTHRLPLYCCVFDPHPYFLLNFFSAQILDFHPQYLLNFLIVFDSHPHCLFDFIKYLIFIITVCGTFSVYLIAIFTGLLNFLSLLDPNPLCLFDFLSVFESHPRCLLGLPQCT